MLPSIHVLPSVGCAGIGFALGIPALSFAFRMEAEVGLPPLPRSLSPVGLRKKHLAIGDCAAGVAAALIGLVLGWAVVTLALAACAAIGVALALVDFRCRRLPYHMTAALYLICGLAFVIAASRHGNWPDVGRSTLAAVTATIFFFVLAMAFPGQLGLGDVFLFGWVAFSLGWFGWRSVAIGGLVGTVGQAIAGAVVRARSGPGVKLPMGPALLAGWLAGIVLAG
jgi:prepilin signal peptidase PulO-like enzyme (type II secretory pathway)